MKYSEYISRIISALLCLCLTATIMKAQSSDILLSSSYQQKELKIEKGTDLSEALKLLKDKYDVVFLYRTDVVQSKKVTETTYLPPNVEEALKKILKGQKLRFEHTNYKTYGIYPEEQNTLKEKAASKAETVSGQVTDAGTGGALAGVNIKVKETTTGTFTGSDGQYSLQVASLQDTLVFSFVGYQKKTVPINGRTTVDVALTTQTFTGEEMVVIGYGKQERSDITGSISSVGEDEVSSVSVNSVQNALQGRISGVEITPSTGQPGAPVDMNIRGISTFGNNNPLFVIDGVPVFSESGGTINPLATLNPSEIKSVEVLKDASAAAIYGARAANGVVLISTKKGESGPTQFSVNLSRGVSTVPDTKKIDLMNSQQFVNYSTEAFENAEKNVPIGFQEPLLSENLSRNTDWQDAIFEPATKQSFSFTVSGGNENATYSFTSGYHDEQGTMPNSSFKRYTARINTNFDIGKDLTIGENIELSRGIWDGMFDPTSDIMQQVLQSSPTQLIYNESNLGGFAGPKSEYGPVNRANEVGILSLTDNEESHNRLLGNIFAEYEIINNLSYRLSLGGDISLDGSKTFTPRYEMGSRSNPTADLSEGRFSTDTYIIENTLTYEHTFNRVHDFTFLVGFTQQETHNHNIDGTVEEFPSNVLRTIDAGTGQTSISGNESDWALRSEIGRINYSYNDRYNLMAAVRRDGSSRFGRNNRYGIFPSLSGSWNITNEAFMQEVEPLTNLTLRASWGRVGSQEMSNYASISTIEPVARYIIGESQQLAPGATYLQLGNPNLQWETTTQTNIGLDIGFLNQSLSFTMDYYIKKTDDILLRVPIPTTSGIRRDNGAYQNAGSLRNEGFEFSVNYHDNIGNLNYNLSGNFTTSRNKVTSLGTDVPIIAQLNSDPNYATTITQVGGEVGAFYGYVMDGVFENQSELDNHAEQPGAAPGDIRFKDLNNDGVVNADDQTVIGSPFPDFSYGMNINLNYESFDMKIFFQGKQGHDIFNLLWAGINDGEGDNNATTEMLNRWTPSNKNTSVPRAINGDPNQNYRPSTRLIEDGSYLRIKNIQLGYNFGTNLLDLLKVSKLRVYISVENLYTFTEYRSFNPEVGTLTTGSRSSLTRGIDFGAYPIPRTIEGGLQVNFD